MSGETFLSARYAAENKKGKCREGDGRPIAIRRGGASVKGDYALRKPCAKNGAASREFKRGTTRARRWEHSYHLDWGESAHVETILIVGGEGNSSNLQKEGSE